MVNEKIRQEAKAAHVPLWEIAAQIGVSEPTITRWMRAELDEERKKQIRGAISEILQKRLNAVG